MGRPNTYAEMFWANKSNQSEKFKNVYSKLKPRMRSIESIQLFLFFEDRKQYSIYIKDDRMQLRRSLFICSNIKPILHHFQILFDHLIDFLMIYLNKNCQKGIVFVYCSFIISKFFD